PGSAPLLTQRLECRRNSVSHATARQGLRGRRRTGSGAPDLRHMRPATAQTEGREKQTDEEGDLDSHNIPMDAASEQRTLVCDEAEDQGKEDQRRIFSLVGVPIVINKMDPHLFQWVQDHLPFKNPYDSCTTLVGSFKTLGTGHPPDLERGR